MITYLDTETTETKNLFLLTQCRIDGMTRTCAEKEMEFNSRLEAACVNVGLVCKWLGEKYSHHETRFIVLQSDTLNIQQYRYQNEHNLLVSLLKPSNKFEHQKHLSLYKTGVFGNLGKHFDKAKLYLKTYKVNLLLSDSVESLPETRYLAEYNII